MNNFCTFYVVRHGQTELNVEGRIQGHADSPLTALGIQQVQETGSLLKDVQFDYVFSSDLLRAKRTAEIIKLDRQLEVLTTELLRERNFGPFEKESIHGKIIQEFDAVVEKLAESEKPFYKVHPKVESDNEVVTRFITFIREIAVRYPKKTILLVTHGGIMRGFLIHIGFGNSQTLGYDAISNSAYIKFESDGIEFVVKETKGVKKHE